MLKMSTHVGESVTLFSWVSEAVVIFEWVTNSCTSYTNCHCQGHLQDYLIQEIRVKILEGLTSLFCLVDTMLYFIM